MAMDESGSPGDDRECVKCGQIKPGASWDALEECPACGVIMSRAKPRPAPKVVAAEDLPQRRPARKIKQSDGDRWVLFWIAAIFLPIVAIGALSIKNPVPPSSAQRSVAPVKINEAEIWLDDARYPCKEALTRIARYQIRFKTMNIAMPDRGRMVAGKAEFYGEDLEAQNGFGAWQRMGYVCTYDPVRKVATARAFPLG